MSSRKKYSLLLVALLALPSTVFAADAKAEKDEPINPWTRCGIGAMIFTKTGWAAAISNVIWDAGTTAVTSAISSKHTCEGKKVAAALFINETYANIEEETAAGNGAHIVAMLNILGCDSAAQPGIAAAIRNDFAKSVLEPAYAQKTGVAKAEQYYNIVDAKVSGEYAQQCRAS